MGRLYLFLCLCLGMFGCMASSLSSVGSDGASLGGSARETATTEMTVDASNSPAASGSANFYNGGSGNSIVLNRHSDGHFYANVSINGTAIEMLVDTGASGIALSENDARRVGLASSIGMHDQVGEGAGGAVYGDVVDLERVRLGDVEVGGVQAVVLKGGSMSLLGQSFLSKFGKVEIEGDRMVLRA